MEEDAEAAESGSARTRVYEWSKSSKSRDAFSFRLSAARKTDLLERAAELDVLLTAPAPAPAGGAGQAGTSSTALAPTFPAFDLSPSPAATPGCAQGPAQQQQQQQGLPDTISYKKLYACQLHDMLAVFRLAIWSSQMLCFLVLVAELVYWSVNDIDEVCNCTIY